MPFVFKRLALVLSIAAALGMNKAAAADKDQPKFVIAPAASYAAHQTSEQVTIAAAVVETDEQARAPFGKLNPYKYGILPVLIVIQNDSNETLRLDTLKVDYVAPGGEHVESTAAGDIRYLHGARRPNPVNGPMPTGAPRISRHKNPLDAWEIEGRAFSAKMIPPGQSAGGFFYFQTGHRSAASAYINGIKQARAGKELFYFEIPLRNATF